MNEANETFEKRKKIRTDAESAACVNEESCLFIFYAGPYSDHGGKSKGTPSLCRKNVHKGKKGIVAGSSIPCPIFYQLSSERDDEKGGCNRGPAWRIYAYHQDGSAQERCGTHGNAGNSGIKTKTKDSMV